MPTVTKYVLGALVIVILIVAIVSYIEATQSPFPQPTPTPIASPTATAVPSPTPHPSSPSPAPTSPAPTATSTPELSEQETIRDSVMNYIKTNHPETAQFMKDLVWTGGRATAEGVIGAERYAYYALGWNLTMSYPVVPDPIYKITADYKMPGIGIPIRIIWEGTWQNQDIKETNYVFAQ